MVAQTCGFRCTILCTVNSADFKLSIGTCNNEMRFAYFYHPQTKLSECNVFTSVCLSTGEGVAGLCHRKPPDTDLPPPHPKIWLTGGPYASYQNTYLILLCKYFHPVVEFTMGRKDDILSHWLIQEGAVPVRPPPYAPKFS